MGITTVKKSVTPRQWLVHSIGWTVGSLAGWVLLMSSLWYEQIGGTASLVMSFGGAFITHSLIWWKAVDGSWWRHDVGLDELLAFGVAKLWLMVLLVFQIGCLFLLLSLLGLLFGNSEGGNWGSPKT
ncbi:hypothetical protein [Hymenobacter daeguensis]